MPASNAASIAASNKSSATSTGLINNESPGEIKNNEYIAKPSDTDVQEHSHSFNSQQGEVASINQQHEHSLSNNDTNNLIINTQPQASKSPSSLMARQPSSVSSVSSNINSDLNHIPNRNRSSTGASLSSSTSNKLKKVDTSASSIRQVSRSSSSSNRSHSSLPYPHIVRPIPVFVADQAIISKKTSLASADSSRRNNEQPDNPLTLSNDFYGTVPTNTNNNHSTKPLRNKSKTLAFSPLDPIKSNTDSLTSPLSPTTSSSKPNSLNNDTNASLSIRNDNLASNTNQSSINNTSSSRFNSPSRDPQSFTPASGLVSGVNRWTSFVTSTIRPDAFDNTTRIDFSELNKQYDLESEWKGLGDDAQSKNSQGSMSIWLRYLVCCCLPLSPQRSRYPASDLNGSGEKIYQGGPSNYHPRSNNHIADDSSSSSNPAIYHYPDGMNFRNVRQNAMYYMERKKKKWQPKIIYILLNNPLIPLTLRLFNFILSVIGLALACSIYVKSRHSQVDQQPSILMAIVVQSFALVYLTYISYDEYSGKPLGIRDFKEKMRLIMLDLLFILFSSANVSLAFNTLFDPMWLCRDEKVAVSFDPESVQELINSLSSVTGKSAETVSNFYARATATLTGLNTEGNSVLAYLDPTPYDAGICQRQRGLVSFLIVILASWIVTFTISMFRLMERISA